MRDALDRWGRETLLLYFLSAHWRKPIDFSEETVAQAAARLQTLRDALTSPDGAGPYARGRAPGWGAFVEALDDDFNTPEALAVMHQWAAARERELLRHGLAFFGLGSVAEREEAPPEVVSLAERRAAARAARDFETSDRLRDELAALGWTMRDRADGFDLVRS
jgi:cysteinyl-tRNA synthetase